MIVGIQNEILKIESMGLLKRLLEDKTTKTNIIWGTDAYKGLGREYERNQEVKEALITGRNSGVIKNRARKELEQQNERTRQHAEVFTPIWICKLMNDSVEEGWFYKDNPHPFDNDEKIEFPKHTKWQSYVDARRLEITCGEAPYLVSRYDVSTGESIPIKNRIGVLDRKLRVVNENTDDEAEWMKWVIRAFQATYGYEFQGDNLLIARVNLLMTFEEYVENHLDRKPTFEEYRTIANIIAWNIWQMDGLTGTLPYCKAEEDNYQLTLFDLFGESEEQENKQPSSRIYDWRRDNSFEFNKLKERGTGAMKFDYIIGNPPYQDETIGENKGFAPPIYHNFLEEAYKIADKVEMIHPARFLFDAGSTPKAWNRKMLSDPHLKVVWYEAKSANVFSNTDIKGGVVVTYRDAEQNFGAIETFTPFDELNGILKKVAHREDFVGLNTVSVSRTAYRLTDKMHEDYPNAIDQLSKGHAYDMSTNIFERLPQIFYADKPNDGNEYVRILGRINNERTYRYVRADYVNDSVINFKKYKVFLAKANGSGALGEVMSTPLIGEPLIGSTESFLSIGIFDTEAEVVSAMKYIKSKFARVMLGILKTTQDITPDKWKYVPLQDFTQSSDIDWSKSVAEIDQQLYAKYGLSKDEIEFIESHVKEME